MTRFVFPNVLAETNGLDFCHGDNPEQEPMKIDTDTKYPNRFNPQQNTDDNQNILYEKRNGKTFTRSYRMNLPKTAKFIASTYWDKVPLPNRYWEGNNDYDEKSLGFAWKSKTS